MSSRLSSRMDRQSVGRRLNFRGSGTTRGFENEQHWDSHSNLMISAPQLLIEKAEAGRGPSRSEAEAFMEEVLSGRVPTPEIVRMLLALDQRAACVAEFSVVA